ncbi:hypothetical protein [Armatimonas rosea]|uniref:Uncharacterized protein n=1 Tax=Armatimonas rosea TaxID=685828 RepID=A0A7W9SM82_ARMRO|nr:hypothetical protein [Armatimonas rosea]MBB6049226.1 hypothetical protein [Armatimonas rosea]
MRPNETKFMEHLAFRTEFPLEELCEIARTALELPPFRYDNENETEWGIAVKEGVEYNLSRPYEEGTLQHWDATVPPGCNFGMTLLIPYTSALPPETVAPLVAFVGQTLSRSLNTTVWHHRRWLGAGRNVPQKTVFPPS